MTRRVASGEIVAVFNEERFPYHHDSGQTLLTRSPDGGLSWSAPEIVLPWTDTTGNWDCGFCELSDGTWIVNLTITGFFKRGVKPDGVSWSAHPMTAEWGDWTWAYKTQAWLGTAVVKSKDRGKTWSAPIPVNVRPMKHGGCRVGCWELPSGSLLMGLYGRIHGYEEEGEGEATRSALMRSDDRRRQLGIFFHARLRPGGDHRLRGARPGAAQGRAPRLLHAHARQSVGRRQEHGDGRLRG